MHMVCFHCHATSEKSSNDCSCCNRLFFKSTDPRCVLMNQHMLLHLKQSVLDHGPLWSSSLFVFEDWNDDIGNYFHGTQNIATQVSLR